MFARVYSGGLSGVDAYRIEVEVDCGGGMGQIHIVGLPDAAVQESAERVRSAIKACEFVMAPGRKWVVNLAPGDLRKEGPIYDLPIAAGILASTGSIAATNLSNFWIIGELSLDGSVRSVAGVLPIAFACKQSGAESIIVPESNAAEAALVEGLAVYPVSHLRQVCGILSNPAHFKPLPDEIRELHCVGQIAAGHTGDYSEVKGQARAKYALEIAAAGRHNVLMVGPPGSGKSMLAQRLPSIMPALEFSEALEVTKLYSIAGLLQNKSALIGQRPFRAPHHSASTAGLLGGGTIPKPGEISLSHFGILFLDELTEFPRSHLETLRQPLESGNITISRLQQTLTYPASFLFVGACNPCPCGYSGDSAHLCNCNDTQERRYWSKLSGPLLDRVDLKVGVKRLTAEELVTMNAAENSESILLRVMRAIEMQRQRNVGGGLALHNGQVLYNAYLPPRQIRRICNIDEPARQMLARDITAMGLSARAYDRTLCVARTIADLKGEEHVTQIHIGEALTFRAPAATNSELLRAA